MRTLDSDTPHSSYRPLLIAGAGVLAVAVAIALNYHRGIDDLASPATVPGQAVTTIAPVPVDTAAAPIKPTFDIARIDTTGDAVLAGRASSGVTVIVKSDGQPIGEATTDHRGEWVFVPEAPLPAGAHRLTLEVPTADGNAIASEGEVLIIIPEPNKDIAGTPATGGSRPIAILMPRSGDAAPTVLQAPGEAISSGKLTVDVVDIDASGRLAASGRASVPGSTVRVIVDDRVLGQANVDGNGRWTLSPRPLSAANDHTLRVEELDRSDRIIGSFVSRLRLIPAKAAEEQPTGTIVVQRGDNLWRIARNAYGQGVAYTIIFQANRSRINDPNVIFPGQTFKLPNSD